MKKMLDIFCVGVIIQQFFGICGADLESSAQVLEVNGVVGGRVEFACDVSVESTDHPDLSWKPTERSALVHYRKASSEGYSNFDQELDPLAGGYLVLWFYENERKPIYSYDARTTSNFGHHWSDPARFGKRAWFISMEQTGVSAARLQVTDLVAEDAGVYRCRVDYKSAPSKYYKYILNVIVPPRTVSITDGEDRVLGSVAGPLEVGKSLILSCSASGGSPQPHVSWWHGAALFDNVTERIEADVVSNTMVFHDLKRTNLHDIFTCQTSPPPPAAPILKMVSIELLLEPLFVTLELPTKPLIANQTAEIKCRAVGSRPAALLSWWIAGKQLVKGVSTKNADDGNITVSILSLIPAAADDGKHITCRVENPMLPGTALEDTARLDIQYPPRVTLEYGSKISSEEIKEGEDTYMECQVQGNPLPHKLQWFHDDVPIVQNASAGIILSNYSLVLQRLTLARIGQYRCKATNQRGETLSSPLALRIQYAPRCPTDEVVKAGGARGETTTLSCQVDSDPVDVHFWWTFTPVSTVVSEAVLLPRTSFSVSGTKSVLHYVPKSENDFGTIGCWASNNAGSQKDPCLFQVVAAGRPSPVKNCTASNISFDAFRISCDASWDGGLPQSFELEVLDPWSRQVLQTLSSPTSWFEVKGLEPGYPFLIVVYATNVKGRSDEVTLEVQTHKENDKESGQTLALQFYMTPLFAILAGAAGTILVLVILIALIVHRQHLQKRRRNEMARIEAEKRTLTGSGSWSDGAPSSGGIKVEPDLLPHDESYFQAVPIDGRLVPEVRPSVRPSELSLTPIGVDPPGGLITRTLGRENQNKHPHLAPYTTLPRHPAGLLAGSGDLQRTVSTNRNLPESTL